MFPTFNEYSTSLLLLSIQGVVFCVMLLRRYYRLGDPSDFLLGVILLITCYHQTSYTMGFMGWYDTYPNTKINYYLLDLALLLPPLIYLYIRSVTSPGFTLQRVSRWHFLPIALHILIQLIILGYDAAQPGFDEEQNGVLKVNFEFRYLGPILFFIITSQMLLYLAFSFQVLIRFREQIRQFYANTYKLELNWLMNFLIVYSFLYLFYSVQEVVDTLITDLSWTREWWFYFLSGIAIIYVGVRGYFTKIAVLQDLDFSPASGELPSAAQETFRSTAMTTATGTPAGRSGTTDDPLINTAAEDQLRARAAALTLFMQEEKPYLDPELTLVSLAGLMGMSRKDLSDVINQGLSSRFNDFINGYRVEETKRLIADGKHKTLSLLGLAYEAGFNSKATFNRAFRKAEGCSPTEYLESLMNVK